jgi:hypothetical protein
VDGSFLNDWALVRTARSSPCVNDVPDSRDFPVGKTPVRHATQIIGNVILLWHFSKMKTQFWYYASVISLGMLPVVLVIFALFYK